jgi:2-oxoglutarate ferredoxin oxidoreductase subunit gamma
VLLSLASGLYDDKEVAQTQSYGPEARGGACRAEVVISDAPIDFIKVLNPDVFVVMSQPAMDKYAPAIDPLNTLVIADATLVRRIPQRIKRRFAVMATQVAEREFGQALFANIVMLGALSALTGLAPPESLVKALQGNVPLKTLDQNRSALMKGYGIGLELKTGTLLKER